MSRLHRCAGWPYCRDEQCRHAPPVQVSTTRPGRTLSHRARWAVVLTTLFLASLLLATAVALIGRLVGIPGWASAVVALAAGITVGILTAGRVNDWITAGADDAPRRGRA